jgi:hypothetical protein
LEVTQKQQYWQEQLKVYGEGSNLAAKISIATNLAAVQKERERFWTLYWGQISLVEDPVVLQAMVTFGDALYAWEQAPSKKPPAIEDLSFDLAHCFRKSLDETWTAGPAPLLTNKCPWTCRGWEDCTCQGERCPATNAADAASAAATRQAAQR